MENTPATAYYVEFHNCDVGPFRTQEEAELYRVHEGNLDETQVFTTDKRPTVRWLDLATFCPDALKERNV